MPRPSNAAVQARPGLPDRALRPSQRAAAATAQEAAALPRGRAPRPCSAAPRAPLHISSALSSARRQIGERVSAQQEMAERRTTPATPAGRRICAKTHRSKMGTCRASSMGRRQSSSCVPRWAVVSTAYATAQVHESFSKGTHFYSLFHQVFSVSHTRPQCVRATCVSLFNRLGLSGFTVQACRGVKFPISAPLFLAVSSTKVR